MDEEEVVHDEPPAVLENSSSGSCRPATLFRLRRSWACALYTEVSIIFTASWVWWQKLHWSPRAQPSSWWQATQGRHCPFPWFFEPRDKSPHDVASSCISAESSALCALERRLCREVAPDGGTVCPPFPQAASMGLGAAPCWSRWRPPSLQIDIVDLP